MYYIVMLKPDEKHNQVCGTERQMIERNLPLKATVRQYTPILRRLQKYDGNIKSLMGVNRMEVYSVGNIFDERTYHLETTVY